MIGGLSSKGSTEEFEFWSDLGVDFMMVAAAYDYFLSEDRVSQLLRLRDRFSLNILIHPRPDGRILLSPANPEAHVMMIEALESIRRTIQRHGLINKVIVHLATCRIPKGDYRAFGEEEAVSNSQSFYQQLGQFEELRFAVENVYPPGIGWEELGYETDHFHMFDLPENCEFCIDTGHLNLSGLNVDDILGLPFEITCLHLHSNDGKSDQHVPLTQRNFDEWERIESLLSDDKYIVMEVKNGLEGAAKAVECLKQNRIAP